MDPCVRKKCEHVGVCRPCRRMLLELNLLEATGSLSLDTVQILPERMHPTDGLKLLKMSDEDHKRARAEFTKGRLETGPYLFVHLADFVKDDIRS